MKSNMLFVGAMTLFAAVIAVQASAANPVPLINQPLVPDAIKPGSAGFTLTVNGTGFVSGSVVHWNGSARTTAFVSRSRLTASILSSDIAKPGTARVKVVNPGPGGGTSNVVFFEVTIPTSSIVLSSPLDFGAGAGPGSVVTGDCNGDSKLDLVVSNSDDGSISVLRGNGDGTFQSAGSYGAGSSPISLAVGDFNGDGKLDLAVANYGTNYASVLLGNGDATFKGAVSYGAGSSPVSVAVGDFNGDGKLDLVVANQNSNNVSVLLGNGDGTFQAAVDYGAGSTLDWVTVGDFNGDGRLDLAVANYGSNNISVLRGNGDGTFRTAVNYRAGLGPDSVAVGDVNGDGKPDLIVANNCVSSNCANGSVGVLLGNGDGTFRTAVNYGVGANPGSMAAGDFNGDRKLDVAVVNFSTGKVNVLLGNGDGTFQAALNFGAGFEPRSIAVGDFNGDGRLDLAVAITGTDAVSILLQAPGASLSSTNLKFANQLIGTGSTPQTLTLTNASVSPLSINRITVTGTDATDFSQTDTCSSSLLAGASCRISITFKPTQIGPRTASVEVTDSEFGSPQLVALSGTGVTSGPNATLSRTTLTFPTQLVGTTSPGQSFMLTNYGRMTLNITSIVTSGDFRQTHTCGSSLAPGASCMISVTFKPTQRGPRTGTLSIADNAPSNQQAVTLNGTGTIVELVPISLHFICKGRSCGTPSQTTTLTNTGSTTLNITGILITGPARIYYSQTNTCGTSVGAGKSCTITVGFRPPDFGIFTAAVSISDDGGGSPQKVSLTANVF
jgi:hypothetical protein